MRYDKRITFVSESGGGYNPETGSHDESTIIKYTMACNISNIGVDRSVQLFGEIDTSVVVVRLQRPYTKPFDYALIKGKEHRVKRGILHDSESVFYMEGVT